MPAESRSNAHRTAIVRNAISRPTQLAITTALLRPGQSFFDYGCGRGEDIAALADAGYAVEGWDPHFRPHVQRSEADVVNIGYVVNAIADPIERVAALQDAWRLARRVLVVSARLTSELRSVGKGRPYGDGFLTGNDTFQRFYGQNELRDWVGAVLSVEPVAVAPGVFAVFRDDQEANAYVLRTRPRRSITVRVSRADDLYDANRQVLDQLMAFFSERGRVPAPGEAPQLEAAVAGTTLGSYRRAWKVIQLVTDQSWDDIVAVRRQDLLVDLALLKLNRRPAFGHLPATTRADVKAALRI